MAYYGNLKHPLQGKIYTKIKRPDTADVRTIGQTYTGFLVDRIGKHGALTSRIKPLDPESRVCGPAVTVLGPELSLRRAAADVAEPGDVLIIAAGGSDNYACFGDGTARKMAVQGVQGVVVDGSVRDARRITRLGFPCFCLGVTVANYDYPVFPKLGAVNVPVSCGGTIVDPGDLIVGDSDGVLCIPRSFVAILAENLLEDLHSETAERLQIDNTFRFGVESELLERGYEFIEEYFESTRGK